MFNLNLFAARIGMQQRRVDNPVSPLERKPAGEQIQELQGKEERRPDGTIVTRRSTTTIIREKQS